MPSLRLRTGARGPCDRAIAAASASTNERAPHDCMTRVRDCWSASASARTRKPRADGRNGDEGEVVTGAAGWRCSSAAAVRAAVVRRLRSGECANARPPPERATVQCRFARVEAPAELGRAPIRVVSVPSPPTESSVGRAPGLRDKQHSRRGGAWRWMVARGSRRELPRGWWALSAGSRAGGRASRRCGPTTGWSGARPIPRSGCRRARSSRGR